MAGVNKVILIGNLGADPEVKYLSNGTTVANFRIATSETRANRSGEKVTTTEWHRIVTFGRLAEICGEYLKKGRPVAIEGKLQVRTFEKNGEKRTVAEVLADGMQMLGRKTDGTSEPHSSSAQAKEAPHPEADEGDVPF